MSKATFEKISESEAPLYGPRKLLLCGFPQAAHPKFNKVLEYAGIPDVPVAWIADDTADTGISELLEMPDGTGAGIDSNLPRAIIVAGITQKQLHMLMNVCKKTGMKQALWATITPTSEKWTINQLLAELEQERKALNK